MIYRILSNQKVRNLIPSYVKSWIAENRVLLYPIRKKSKFTNIYHCCIHKTGSQWIRKIFSDPLIYKYTGMRTFNYQSRYGEVRKLKNRIFVEPFPYNRIITPLYVNYYNFSKIPKPFLYKSIFIMRDPRDIVVSWYFSTAYSHPIKNKKDKLYNLRNELIKLSITDGLIFSIQYLNSVGLFDALRSWKENENELDELKIFKYENLSGANGLEYFKNFFRFLDINLLNKEIKLLINKYSFKNLSGRDKGQENINSKYRKGIPGDWRNYFNNKIENVFNKNSVNLTEYLNY